MLHAREHLIISLDEIFRFSQGQVGGARQPEGAHAVDQTEIDGLGVPALVLGNLVQRHFIDRGSRGRVNVLPGAESRQHGFIFSHVGRDAQLDLGIVHRKQQAARRGHKSLAHLVANSVRVGMFCRLGSEEARRPVTEPVWLKEVCTRPVRGLTCLGSASR